MQELLRHADDLDYLQTLVTSLGKKIEINPSVNAVIDAHNRRRFKGRFKTEGQSVELDTLLHQDTKEVPDDKFIQRKLRCRAFQKDECTWPSCRFSTSAPSATPTHMELCPAIRGRVRKPGRIRRKSRRPSLHTHAIGGTERKIEGAYIYRDEF